jgi:hypothetical protein
MKKVSKGSPSQNEEEERRINLPPWHDRKKKHPPKPQSTMTTFSQPDLTLRAMMMEKLLVSWPALLKWRQCVW